MKKNIILLVCVFNVDISLSTEIAPSTPIPSIVTDGSINEDEIPSPVFSSLRKICEEVEKDLDGRIKSAMSYKDWSGGGWEIGIDFNNGKNSGTFEVNNKGELVRKPKKDSGLKSTNDKQELPAVFPWETFAQLEKKYSSYAVSVRWDRNAKEWFIITEKSEKITEKGKKTFYKRSIHPFLDGDGQVKCVNE